jgi:hypothetical protein
LSSDWWDWLDLRRHKGCHTSNCSFNCGCCQKFAAYTSGKMPTTPELDNSCSCGVATSAWMVRSGELWVDPETVYHKSSSRPSHPWSRKHSISVYVHRGDLRWISLSGLDPMTGVDWKHILPFLPQQFPSPFFCSWLLVPSLRVENESTFEGLKLWYSWT